MLLTASVFLFQLMHNRPHNVRYQIVNHVLHRSAECSFPSRCNGIEHFLQAAAKVRGRWRV